MIKRKSLCGGSGSVTITSLPFVIIIHDPFVDNPPLILSSVYSMGFRYLCWNNRNNPRASNTSVDPFLSWIWISIGSRITRDEYECSSWSSSFRWFWEKQEDIYSSEQNSRSLLLSCICPIQFWSWCGSTKVTLVSSLLSDYQHHGRRESCLKTILESHDEDSGDRMRGRGRLESKSNGRRKMRRGMMIMTKIKGEEMRNGRRERDDETRQEWK